MCIIRIIQQKIAMPSVQMHGNGQVNKKMSTLSVQMHGNGSKKNVHVECTNVW